MDPPPRTAPRAHLPRREDPPLTPAGKNCMQWVTNVTYCAEGARRRRPTHDHTSTAPKAPAEGGRHTSTAFLLKNAPISLKNTIFLRAPSARAFGAGLRPRPSANITYCPCNRCRPAQAGRLFEAADRPSAAWSCRSGSASAHATTRASRGRRTRICCRRRRRRRRAASSSSRCGRIRHSTFGQQQRRRRRRACA